MTPPAQGPPRWRAREQRARTAEKPWTDLRNHVAHGASGIDTPVAAARMLRDLAEFVNQLWGSTTLGGRLYPASVTRIVTALSWNSDTGNRTVWTTAALRDQNYLNDERETFLLVRAVAQRGTFPVDHHLLEFDARFETTMYPADYLWGPGTRTEALLWLDEHQPGGDSVDHVDRVLLLRKHDGSLYLPMRPEAAAGIVAEHRTGRWHTVRADFPNDAYAHVRSRASNLAHRGRPGRDCPAEGCPVHVLGSGSHREALEAATAVIGRITPALPPAVGVPPIVPRPNRF